MPTLKSPRSVAEQLGVSYRTVLRLIEAGELRAYRVGSRLRVAEHHVEEFLEAKTINYQLAPEHERPFYGTAGSLVRLSQELQTEGL